MQRVYICGGVRTPIGRYAGALSALRTDDLAAYPLRALREKFQSVNWDDCDEVVLGCANQAGEDNRNVARMAALLAGFSPSVPAVTVNRLCGSGLDAVAYAARIVLSGDADIVVAGGVESMSRAPLVIPKAETAFSRAAEIADTTIGWRFVNPRMDEAYGTDALGITAENVAEEYGISREDQDRLAAHSQQKAAAARASGRFAQEIVAVEVSGRKTTTCIEDDEHIRPDTSLDTLAKLRPAFKKAGTVTAGNSSGVNDGACALLLASEAAVKKYGLEPIARITGFASAGVLPRVMGIGPIPATEKLMKRQGLTMDQIDIFELNEAFAAQALAITRAWGLADQDPRVNRNGGAIALGHPLGMTGARLVLTSAVELSNIKARRALCSMCVGVGQGVSMLLENA
ncbi:3-oxoadipyl-CoA thiolase [Kordiimonas gwangyangensis]|uniref:3-oxoadipyl-CoA thiolase n=1 Tax=Kordiimonas gwangyangensis TaxID=288022 RepID=UPI0003702388